MISVGADKLRQWSSQTSELQDTLKLHHKKKKKKSLQNTG